MLILVASSTINGTLTLNAGGFGVTNAPTYASGSTLNFATGGLFDINNVTVLWTTGNTLGKGVPANVAVSTTNPLNIYEARDVTGNFTISSDASVVQGNNDFIVQGNLTNNGTYAFESDGTIPLTVKGNFTNASTGSSTCQLSIGGGILNCMEI